MINAEHLTKYYGDFMAVQDISFEIDVTRARNSSIAKRLRKIIIGACLQPGKHGG